MNCGQEISIPQAQAKEKLKCPKCFQRIVLPAEMIVSPEADPPLFTLDAVKSVIIPTIVIVAIFAGLILQTIIPSALGWIGVLVIAALIFWIWTLVDCATKEPSEGNDKIVWILIILLTNMIGAILYFLIRRPKRIQEFDR